MYWGEVNKKLFVKRITVDEKLSTDEIRFLICSLKSLDKEIKDDENLWSKEESFLINEEDYHEKSGLSSSIRKKNPWSNFREGQVFLYGYFKVLGRSPNERYIINSKRINFRRIDTVIKKEIETLFFKALRGETLE